MAEVLADFPSLSMTMPDGREESIMKRTTLVSALSSEDSTPPNNWEAIN